MPKNLYWMCTRQAPDVAWKGFPQAGFEAVQDQIRNDG